MIQAKPLSAGMEVPSSDLLMRLIAQGYLKSLQLKNNYGANVPVGHYPHLTKSDILYTKSDIFAENGLIFGGGTQGVQGKRTKIKLPQRHSSTEFFAQTKTQKMVLTKPIC